MKTYMLGKNKMRFIDYNEPQTIKEAIDILNDYFEYSSKDEKDFFNESITPDIIYQYHHGLGQKMRNAWFWPKHTNVYSDLANLFIKLNIEHPDDMSSFLLKLFWYCKHQSEKSLEEHQERLLNEIIIKDIIE